MVKCALKRQVISFHLLVIEEEAGFPCHGKEIHLKFAVITVF